jgi:hypothetical protein
MDKGASGLSEFCISFIQIIAIETEKEIPIVTEKKRVENVIAGQENFAEAEIVTR